MDGGDSSDESDTRTPTIGPPTAEFQISVPGSRASSVGFGENSQGTNQGTDGMSSASERVSYRQAMRLRRQDKRELQRDLTKGEFMAVKGKGEGGDVAGAWASIGPKSRMEDTHLMLRNWDAVLAHAAASVAPGVSR